MRLKRTGCGKMDWLKIGKGVCQGCILSPCLFNFQAECIMQNTLDESKAGINISGRNINNLTYADDTTLMAEREEELKSLLMRVNREGNGTPLQYSCLENPMDRGAWQAAVHGVAKSRTRLSNFTFTFTHWRRKWQPTPVFLPGESQGWRSLVGCRLWGHTELDTTEATQKQQQEQVGHSFFFKIF